MRFYLDVQYKVLIIILLITGFKTNVFSQKREPDILQKELEGLLSTRYNGSSSMVGKPLPPPDVEGSYHLFDTWKKADIKLKNKQRFDNIAVNIDLYNQLLIVQLDNAERVLEANDIDTIKISNRNFVPAIKLYDDLPFVGFYDVIVKGKVTFIRYYYSIFKKADYKIELNVGDRNDRFITKSDYYIYNDVTAVKFKSTKNLKDLLSEEEYGQIKLFIKSNNLDMSVEGDIRKMVSHYNASF